MLLVAVIMVTVLFVILMTTLNIVKLYLRLYLFDIKEFFYNRYWLFLLFLFDDLVYIFQTINAANHVGDVGLFVLGNRELQLALVLELLYSLRLGGLVVIVEVLD